MLRYKSYNAGTCSLVYFINENNSEILFAVTSDTQAILASSHYYYT